MVIYEWKDAQYLGKTTTPEADDHLPVSLSVSKYIYNLTYVIAENVRLYIKCSNWRILHSGAIGAFYSGFTEREILERDQLLVSPC